MLIAFHGVAPHGDAFSNRDRKLDLGAGFQALMPVALHADERAAHVHLVFDDVAEK